MANRLTRSYLHRGGEPSLLGQTLDERLREVVARHGAREAIVGVPQGIRLDYAALDRRVQHLARALVADGVGRGDRVGIWSTNNVEWVLLQLATARIGAVLVNINPANRVAELEHALAAARVQVLVAIPSFRSSDYVDMIRQLVPAVAERAPDEVSSDRLPALRRVVLYDPADAGATTRPLPGFATWPELLAGAAAVDDADVARRAASLDPDDPINIQFTSGTTGFPKPVVLTHHNLLNNAFFVGAAMRFTEADRLCVPVPFYHCFGMVLANLVCLARGAAIVIPAEHFDPDATLDAVEAEHCTALHGVPTMFIAELERLRARPRDIAWLRTGIIAGAPCAPELVRAIIDELGCREFLIAYGQTEASPVTHMTAVDDSERRRVETVGTNLPHQEVKVVDTDSGGVVPVGIQGEVCFRGYHVMRGYFDDEQATRETIDGAGWLHSGDLGVMDGAGYLRITGRLKDMIIRGGENIYPAEIEAYYYQHPKVRDIAVFGVPDERMGEEVAAWVMLHDGETATAEELREFARGKIAHYKIPRHVRIVDAFPMTVTGKIQKFKMREQESVALSREPKADAPPAS